MTITVNAVVENGMLKPKEPLSLVEGTEVLLIIQEPITHADQGPNSLEAENEGWPEEFHDPLGHLIGICDDGPDISLAEKHDEILYGSRRPGFFLSGTGVPARREWPGSKTTGRDARST